MKAGLQVVFLSMNHPKAMTGLMVAGAIVLAALAALPSLFPETFPRLHPVQVDTDPENMLSHDEPVRVFHDEMKKALTLHDMVVMGIVNESHPNGVFNPESLAIVYELTQYGRTLRGAELGLDDPLAGVVPADMIAPSLVDNIEQGGPGEVQFEWLMPRPPETDEEALAVRDKALRIPFFEGTMVSEDGRAIAIYLPMTSKDLSYPIYRRLRALAAELEDRGTGDQVFITGLPVAEDVFGVEMFIQMAISAPMAMVVIFLLMLLFFKKLILVISPMIVAMATVIITMGLLVVTGNTIHIMSSMIPIFLMPIAVLDSIHILSEFFDRYQESRDRRKTLEHVMESLFRPMLFTSLTSTAGFASLALTPIPPVQVFGIFVAIGIMLAWLLTITFIPAYIMLLPERRLENFGIVHGSKDEDVHVNTMTGRFLGWMGAFTYQRAKLVVVTSLILAVIAVVGITRIEINDNPIKWFRSSHYIRVADRVLNEHFGGTYMAYLSLSPVGERPEVTAADVPDDTELPDEPGLPNGLGDGPGLPSGLDGDNGPGLPAGLDGGSDGPELPAGLGGGPVEAVQTDTPETEADVEIFKHPELLSYIEKLQEHLQETGEVGKSNSLADIVKTVHRELIDGTDEQFRVPDSVGGVAQSLLQYQSSHRPGDLWHFVTPDYRHTSIWIQLRSGDNKDMQEVVEAIDEYVAANPLQFELAGVPVELEHDWFGLTYINVVWQEKMVWGMLTAFLGSFLVVLFMMILLFGSGLWGILSMIPLTITIGLIYGVIGFIGKDYDMPVAVLSSLTLGLAVDFAIHFLARARALYEQHGSWDQVYQLAFGEPARAITRNVIVIAVGFLPLLLAPLVPYNTVGIFLAAILFVSGAGTLMLLPSLIQLLEPLLFPKTRLCSVTCRCGTCIVTGLVAIALIWVNLYHFLAEGITAFTIVSLIAVPLLMIGCYVMSRRERCRTNIEGE